MSSVNTQTRFAINLREGILEISGSEAFVNKKLDEHQDLIGSMLDRLSSVQPVAKSNNSAASPPPGDEVSDNGSSDQNGSVASAFPNVLAISGEDVRVIADIPGANGREQTINAALLYLLGKSSIGQTRVPFKEVREVCKRHGFLDSSNFAQYMKSSKKEITVHGSGPSMEAELTFPGKKAARALAEGVESQA